MLVVSGWYFFSMCGTKKAKKAKDQLLCQEKKIDKWLQNYFYYNFSDKKLAGQIDTCIL